MQGNENTETNNFLVVTDEAEGSKEPEKKADSAPAKDKDKPDGKPAAKADKPKEKKQDDDKDDDDPEKKDPDDKDDDEADSTSGKRHQRRFERRAARLTKRAKTAEERASKVEADLQAAQAELAELKASTTKPKAEDFDKHEDFEKALSKWNESKETPKKPSKKNEPDPEFLEALDEVTDSFEDGKKKHKDFDEVVKSDKLRITEVMIMAMADTEEPAEIAYYLGKHPEEAERIAGLTPLRVAKAIAKIETALSAKAADDDEDKTPDPKKDKGDDDAKPAKKVSQAPAPVKPVKGSDASGKKLEDMDFNEFEQTRNQAGKSKSFW